MPACPKDNQATTWHGTSGTESQLNDVWKCPKGHETTTPRKRW